MYNMVMFNTREELRGLTGLPGDNYDAALWAAGFDLDDWDVGFQSDKPLYKTEIDEEDGHEYETAADDAADWLTWQMDGYCCGATHTEYGGKHYYLVHHA